MDRQTLRDWVHRYNASAWTGCVTGRVAMGHRPRLSAEQEATVIKWVEQGRELNREFSVELHESTVGKMLRRHKFTRLQPRPHDPITFGTPTRRSSRTS